MRRQNLPVPPANSYGGLESRWFQVQHDDPVDAIFILDQVAVGIKAQKSNSLRSGCPIFLGVQKRRFHILNDVHCILNP